MGGIIGGLFQASAAKKAANQQAAAAAQDLAFQRETRDLIFDRTDPFYQSGITAQNALNYELGLGNRPMIGGAAPQVETFTETMSMGQPTQGAMPYFGPGKTGEEARQRWQSGQGQGLSMGQPASTTRYRVGGQTFDTMDAAQAYATANPTGGTEYRGFQATPGYQFALDQGNNNINALAGARGGLNSGRTLEALQNNGIGMANQEYGNYLNRLTGMAGSGQNAAGMQANAATNAASGVSNALSGIGNAQSAGTIGAANGIAGGINNQLALFRYQQGVAGNNNGGLNIGNSNFFNPLFGGKGLGGFV